MKGIVLLVLTLLGGASAAFVVAKINELKREELGAVTPEQFEMIREKALIKLGYDPDMAHALAPSPDVLLGLLNLTIWLTPMLVALMGFDAIAPDLQHRSVRYWSIRSRRGSFFVGKWAGLWLTVSAVTLTMDAIIWAVCVIRGEATLAVTLRWGVSFWLVSLPMSAIWCGIATLVSSLFRQPIVALLLTFAAFFVLWVVYLIAAFAGSEPLAYLYPNFYDHLLLHPAAQKLATGLGASFGMAAIYVGAGSFIFSKRDV